jgi:hypothetical protein
VQRTWVKQRIQELPAKRGRNEKKTRTFSAQIGIYRDHQEFRNDV